MYRTALAKDPFPSTANCRRPQSTPAAPAASITSIGWELKMRSAVEADGRRPPRRKRSSQPPGTVLPVNTQQRPTRSSADGMVTSSSFPGEGVTTSGGNAADPVADVAPLDAAKAVGGGLRNIGAGAASAAVLLACAVGGTDAGAQSRAEFVGGAVGGIGAGAESPNVLVGGAVGRADATAASMVVLLGDAVGGVDADAVPPAVLVEIKGFHGYILEGCNRAL